jgi:ABC-type phosphate transport system substrate-binding protein
MRALACVLTLAIVLAASTSGAEDHAFKVIVNPDNGVDGVEHEFLRDAYLKKIVGWDDGTTIRPIDLTAHHPVRERFDDQVLHKTPAQLRAYWTQQIFSGKAVPPPEADSVADAIAYVLQNKGAIAYVPAEVDTGKAKVVRLK